MRLADAVGRKEVREYEPGRPEDEELAKKVHGMAYDKVYAIAKAGSAKHERGAAFAAIKDEILESYFTLKKNWRRLGIWSPKYYRKGGKSCYSRPYP